MRRAATAAIGASAALGWQLSEHRDINVRVTSLRGENHPPPTVTRHAGTNTRAGHHYYQVALASAPDETQPLLRNSVLLVPRLLNETECRILVRATENAFEKGLSSSDDAADPLQRLRLMDLSADARRVARLAERWIATKALAKAPRCTAIA